MRLSSIAPSANGSGVVDLEQVLRFDSTHHINAHQLLDLDDSHFADKSHLNIKGANAKTRKLTEIIREIDSP